MDELPKLPARALDAHKGTMGTVAVVGGSVSASAVMLGAPVLAAWSAVRSGAGLVRLVVPEPLLLTALSMCPAATGVPLRVDAEGPLAHTAAETIDALVERCDVLAVGPGLGTERGSQAAVLRCVQQERASLVLDADALTCLAQTPELFRDFHAPAVLTPHPGEFKRLCAGLGLKNDLGLAASRENACTQLAQRLGRIIVLKGQGTVVSDGLRTWVCPPPAGHPCLATGGTGDVLTGLIAALIAQFVPTVEAMVMRARVPRMPVDPARPLDLFDAARLGVLIHARAGEAWAKSRGASGGLAAMDLVELLPGLIEACRK